MNEGYNENHAASIGYVNNLVQEAWNKMETLIKTNVDKSDYVQRVIIKLAEALRTSVIQGKTATEYADELKAAVNSMVEAFTRAGLDMSGITTTQFATCIDSLSRTNGVYIHDADGVLWTAQNWAYQKQQQGGVDPAQREGIMITNTDHNVLIGSTDYSNLMYGTYSHTVPSLQAMDGGVAGTPKDGTLNSRRTLAATNPDLLDEIGWTQHYFEGMTASDLQDVDLVFFPDQATLTAWATSMGLPTMLTLGTAIIYAIPHDSTPNHYVLKYFNGTNSISFANREADAPYTDSYGAIGSPALEAAVNHREHDDDPNFWRGGSAFEAILAYLNRSAINECRDALGEAHLPADYMWVVLQSNYGTQYYVSLSSGSSNAYYKNVKYSMVPFASCTRPKAL